MKRVTMMILTLFTIGCGGAVNEEGPWRTEEPATIDGLASVVDRTKTSTESAETSTERGSAADRDAPDRPDSFDENSCQIPDVTYDYGICVCDDVLAGTVSSHDGAAIGINGEIARGGSVFGGALVVAGGGGITGESVRVGQRLYSGGPVTVDGTMRVGSHAFVDGDVSGERLRIEGRLTQPVGALIDAPDQQIGSHQFGAVDVSEPCDCGGIPDTPAAVEDHRTRNDNAAIGLSAEPEIETLGGGYDLEFQPGTYFFERLDTGGGGMHLNILGDTKIYVANDLVSGGFGIEIAPGATLELYIEGSLLTSGWSVRDAVTHSHTAGDVHVYVGGDTISVHGCSFTGSLTAPNATVVDTSNISVVGKVLVGSVDSSHAKVSSRYDSGLTDDDDSCIGSGRGEGSERCPSGECDPDQPTPADEAEPTATGSCELDSDCAERQVCSGGNCIDVVD